MSIQFKRLCADDIIENIVYFKNCALHLSDYSAAFKIMWQDYFTEYFAWCTIAWYLWSIIRAELTFIIRYQWVAQKMRLRRLTK